jgi:hypothetical protein
LIGNNFFFGGMRVTSGATALMIKTPETLPLGDQNE